MTKGSKVPSDYIDLVGAARQRLASSPGPSQRVRCWEGLGMASRRYNDRKYNFGNDRYWKNATL